MSHYYRYTMPSYIDVDDFVDMIAAASPRPWSSDELSSPPIKVETRGDETLVQLDHDGVRTSVRLIADDTFEVVYVNGYWTLRAVRGDSA